MGRVSGASGPRPHWRVYRKSRKGWVHHLFRYHPAALPQKRLPGLPWCAAFVHAVYIEALGKEKARKLLGKPHPGSRVLMRRFKRRGRLTDTPKVGDIIFLTNGDGLVSHCGIVVCVEDDTVTTVEGNTIDPTGGVKRHEGGAVAQRVRKLTDPAIICYEGVDQHGRNQRI